MKSDWHLGLVSKEYKENFDMIEWETTIKGTSGRYRWRKLIDNIFNNPVISEKEEEENGSSQDD